MQPQSSQRKRRARKDMVVRALGNTFVFSLVAFQTAAFCCGSEMVIRGAAVAS
jgi:hypothetical protein